MVIEVYSRFLINPHHIDLCDTEFSVIRPQPRGYEIKTGREHRPHCHSPAMRPSGQSQRESASNMKDQHPSHISRADDKRRLGLRHDVPWFRLGRHLNSTTAESGPDQPPPYLVEHCFMRLGVLVVIVDSSADRRMADIPQVGSARVQPHYIFDCCSSSGW
ncbi:hypothetical protein BJX64DRAFT_68539 [Aspergillus heterothallicus]